VSWTVRRQLAASNGELPRPVRAQPAIAMLERYGDDPVLVDAALSGLSGSEADVLDRLLQRNPAPQQMDAVTMLAATIARRGDGAAVQQLIARATQAPGRDEARIALLRGIDLGLPRSRGPEGRGGVDVPPLTAEEQRRFVEGAELYKNICLACHQADGRGRENLAPDLVGSAYVTSADAGAATRILLGGKEGQIGLMPPLASALSDHQIASLLTYIRREWGHTASTVAPEDVREIRGLTKTRTRPWTDAELQQVGRSR
jgi:mono/diheme cytochrome c family protein